MSDSVQLNKDEVDVVRSFQQSIENTKSTLGNLRRQYLAAEAKIIGELSKIESDFISHLKNLASSKDIKVDDETWIFDPANYLFRKTTEE